MKAIRQVSYEYDDDGEAADGLAACEAIPGFLFGYVESSTLRTVSFHIDYYPNDLMLFLGQTRVDLVIGDIPK